MLAVRSLCARGHRVRLPFAPVKQNLVPPGTGREISTKIPRGDEAKSDAQTDWKVTCGDLVMLFRHSTLLVFRCTGESFGVSYAERIPIDSECVPATLNQVRDE